MNENFSAWLDGAPVVSPGANGAFDYWLDGAPVVESGGGGGGTSSGTLAGQTDGVSTATGTLAGTYLLSGISAWNATATGTLSNVGSGGVGVGVWAAFPYHRAGPMNVRVPFLNFTVLPWKYRKVSPKGHRVYHLPY